ncbi:MAG: DUF3592 domain-containing protein [Haloarculaceae archaeon]
MLRGFLRGAWDSKDVGFVALLVVIGLGSAAAGGTHVLEHNGAVQENRPVEAVVLSTDVDHRVIENDDGPDDHEYRPVIEYRYRVDGETYTGDNVFPGSFERWRESRSWAADIADDYDRGETVDARYNPSNPVDAYIRNDGWPGEWLVTAGYAAVLLVGGAGLVVQGFRRRRQRELMVDTPTEQAESLSMGPSEIAGVARTNDRSPATAPFTDEECVVSTWRVMEYHEDQDDDGGSWRLVDRGIDGVPFYVDDGTGSVLVKPHVDAVYEMSDDDETTIRVDAGESPPARIREFVETVEGVDRVTGSSGGDDGDRRYHQNLIRPGEEVYVFGAVQPRDGDGSSNVENLVVRKVPEDDTTAEPMFLIADEPEEHLIAERRWALWRVPVGVLAAVAGVGLVLGLIAPFVGLRLPAVPLLV